jgi:hypothetical protein
MPMSVKPDLVKITNYKLQNYNCNFNQVWLTLIGMYCKHCKIGFYTFDICASPEDGPIRTETCSVIKN